MYIYGIFDGKTNRAAADEIKARRITYEVEGMKEYSRNKHVHRYVETRNKSRNEKALDKCTNRWKQNGKKRGEGGNEIKLYREMLQN